jgi:1-acyl-sn-glycerol-3-phosphate acyltransferase
MLHLFVRPSQSAKQGEPVPSPLAIRAAVQPRRWGMRLPFRCFRLLAYPVFRIVIRSFAWLRVENEEMLGGVNGPVILAANHQSDLDTAVLLAALPRSWRYRVAPTACDACFASNGPITRVLKHLHYSLFLLFYNGLTLPRGIAPLRQAFRHMSWLVGKKWSILIYPEGEKATPEGLLPFEAGVGMIATRLQLPVVPVLIDGTHRIWNRSSRMIRPGPVLVRFGAPLWFQEEDYRAATQQVEQAIHALKA